MKDESLYPVAKLQLLLAKLNGMVKRKLLIIDGRLLTKTDVQIEIPIIPEESLDGLSTIYTIYPKSEADYKVVEMDSHPARTNGFLTGCLIETVLNQGHVPI